MTPADELIAHLKHFEGFVAHPYYCAAGKLTIGYGHRIEDPHHPDLTEEQGHQLLLEDIAKYTEMAIRISRRATDLYPVLANASPRRLNAIVDFCFNAGGAAYAGSTLRLKVVSEDWTAAAIENGRWIYVTDPKTRIKHPSQWQVQRRAATSAWLKEG